MHGLFEGIPLSPVRAPKLSPPTSPAVIPNSPTPLPAKAPASVPEAIFTPSICKNSWGHLAFVPSYKPTINPATAPPIAPAPIVTGVSPLGSNPRTGSPTHTHTN